MFRDKYKNRNITEFLRNHWYVWLGAAIILITLVISPLVLTFSSTRGSRYDAQKSNLNEVPYHKVGIVFGAGVQPDGSPTPYLRDRLKTATELYKTHRIDKLLLTADNSSKKYNEPLAMQKYAIKLGVHKEDITLDYAGFNTYDSCYRAKTIFGVTEATLVTQGYHLPRAMVTCSGLGVKNVGVAAIHKDRDFTISYIIREFVSTDKMALQLLFKPHPTALGNPIRIK